jgi:predicted SprT family Zn-dependent metalloprotease
MSASTPLANTTIEAVLARLWEEFAALNAAHFDNSLELKTLTLSTRKQYGGYCVPSQKRIVLSWQAYQDHGWDETLITFRHEVAHLIHPNHSKEFWALAEKLGCPPERKRALPPKERPAAYTRYTYECPVCQTQILRRKRITRASCGKCDRKFNPNFLLRSVSS